MALLETDLLVMQQMRSFLRDDFDITDGAGVPVGRIHTSGSAMSRMFLGSRQLDVLDVDGTPMARLDDVMTFGRDRFSILDGHGYDLGELVKEFSVFRKRLTLTLVTGEVCDVQGNLFDYDYEITGPGGLAAQVGRRWGGITNSLLGRDRYVVAVTPGVPPHLRAAIIASVVALDLIRAKEQDGGGAGIQFGG